ncbi:MAG TPA: hypothetical protein VNG33_09600, partial [Polyangiaceae bacterium]|nr:hypothetical protein [Polyangiaceae bacterium]
MATALLLVFACGNQPKGTTVITSAQGGQDSVGAQGGRASSGAQGGRASSGTGASDAGTNDAGAQSSTGGAGADSTAFAVADAGYVTACEWSGYAWTAAGPAGTASMVAPATFEAVKSGGKLCVKGVVAAQPDYSGYAMLGVNLAQDVTGSTPAEIVPVDDGILVSISNPGGAQIRIQVQDNLAGDPKVGAKHRWCASYNGAGFIPWSDFNTACWDGSGTAYAKQPISAVALLVPGGTVSDRKFDFCVDALGCKDDGSAAVGSSDGTGATSGSGGSMATGGSGGSGGAASSCGAPGDKCATSESCCQGTQCIAGACGNCYSLFPAGDHPKYCALADGSSGACYPENAVCSTATKCTDGLHACTSAAYAYKCATRTCDPLNGSGGMT